MATLQVTTTPRGTSLRSVADRLAGMTDAKVSRLFERHLKKSASPYPRYVRASVLAIPTHGKKHTGLRAVIAQCASVSSGRETRGTAGAWVSVWMDPGKMRPEYLTLPLYMEGAPKYRHWRHPVFGRWLPGQPDQAPHPYFYQAVATFGRAAEFAIMAALEEITGELE